MDLYASLEKSAREALCHFKICGKSNAATLADTVKESKSIIDSAYLAATSRNMSGKKLSGSLQWIYDNYYLYDSKYRILISELKKQKNLPSCPVRESESLSFPIYFCSFLRYISVPGFELNDTSVSAFISAAGNNESYRPGYADFYSFGILWTACVFSRIANVFTSDGSADDIGRMTHALRFLSGLTLDKYIKSCPAEKILLQDPSGDYCNMTDGTKDFYRERLVKLASKENVAEETLARRFLEQARAAKSGKEKHIGFYLYPQQNKLYGYLYFTLLFLLAAVPSALLIRMHPISFITVLPIYEFAKQLSDKFFSCFVRPGPLPRLKIRNLPDTDGVLTVITTVLSKKIDNGLFIRLEDMYNASGMKNVYFALLADYPQSENNTETADAKILSEVNDRINALNLKYGKSFFLFVRNRTYCAKERCFMGYERKRGAIGGLCRYLSGDRQSEFISGTALPDSGVCDRIRFVLTLDSDTNLPPDGIRELAGIMLHPLNRPEINKQKGIVTSGYGILQPAVSTGLKSASKTHFSGVFSGTGGFEIYSFSGFELYQSLFGEGTFCGKGIFDKNAFMSCIENESFAFPENTILSHDILEGARLRTANVTDFHITDEFPKNPVSYLKRHHRWVRGDTQNLIFLKKYIKNKDGKLIKNNISALSKYKLFDNFRRAAVPIFAFRGVIVSCFLKPAESAVVLLFSLFYILFGFISDFASKVSTVGISTTARKYFSKNAIPGLIQSFFRTLTEISMLPSLAITALNAIIVSLYRTFVSKRKMLEWTTASQGDAATVDSLLYYIRKNMFCSIAGSLVYILCKYPVLKLIGLMWFLFPITAYLLGKHVKNKKITPTQSQKNTLTLYAEQIWSYFGDAVTEKSNHLPVDNIQLYPSEIYSGKTSPTNIGLYLISVLAARDFSFIDSERLFQLLNKTIKAIEKLKKWNGHLYNWYNTESCSVIQPKVISSVDSGNFIACLICLKEGLREYVNENPHLLDIIYRTENIIDNTDISKLYDTEKKLFYIDITIEDDKTAVYSQNHFDMLMSEARTLSYIAVAKKAAEVKHYSVLSRPMIKYADRVGVASWTGTAFEYFMPALFMPAVKGSLMYEALRFALYRQKARCAVTENGKVFGISESGYFAFDEKMNYQYKAFGISDLGLKSGLDRDLVISPYSSFLMMSLDLKTPLDNLNRLKKQNVYGKYGFYEAYDSTSSRCQKPQTVKSNMSHHMGMSIIACANAVYDNAFVKRFMKDPAMRSVKELLEERIPVDCIIKKIKLPGKIPERTSRPQNS